MWREGIIIDTVPCKYFLSVFCVLTSLPLPVTCTVVAGRSIMDTLSTILCSELRRNVPLQPDEFMKQHGTLITSEHDKKWIRQYLDYIGLLATGSIEGRAPNFPKATNTWVKNQRHRMKQNRLLDWKISLLNEIGFSWVVNRTFQENVRDLRALNDRGEAITQRLRYVQQRVARQLKENKPLRNGGNGRQLFSQKNISRLTDPDKQEKQYSDENDDLKIVANNDQDERAANGDMNEEGHHAKQHMTEELQNNFSGGFSTGGIFANNGGAGNEDLRSDFSGDDCTGGFSPGDIFADDGSFDNEEPPSPDNRIPRRFYEINAIDSDEEEHSQTSIRPSPGNKIPCKKWSAKLPTMTKEPQRTDADLLAHFKFNFTNNCTHLTIWKTTLDRIKGRWWDNELLEFWSRW